MDPRGMPGGLGGLGSPLGGLGHFDGLGMEGMGRRRGMEMGVLDGVVSGGPGGGVATVAAAVR